jgi:hypothetical protein
VFHGRGVLQLQFAVAVRGKKNWVTAVFTNEVTVAKRHKTNGPPFKTQHGKLNKNCKKRRSI